MLRHAPIFCVSCCLILPLGRLSAQDSRPPEPQLRGPVHEAYAQPVDPQPEPGPIVPQKPPSAIPENPPDAAPNGNDVQWIPGYWAWDSERGEFLWISGTYRNAPPGRQFVPGYWTESAEGWRWVQGYWDAAPGQQGPPTQPQYVPQQPPAPLETGPSGPGPADSIYGPGYWYYQNQNYTWRAGGYYKGAPGWMWIPPHYVWTPNGYLLVPGYWDYPLENRGVLFAPVVFSTPLWLNPAWSYTPVYTINTGLLLDNLFCNGPCFWFGNCYGPYYAGRGFRPWYARNGPYLNHYRWANRGDPQWLGGLQRNYLARANGTMPGLSRADLIVPLNRVANLNRLNPAQVNAHRNAAVRSRDLAQQRFRTEVRTAQVNPGRVNPGFANPGLANKGLANGNKGFASPNNGFVNPGQANKTQPVRPAVNTTSAPRITTANVKTPSTVNRNTAAHPAHTTVQHPAVQHAPAANHRAVQHAPAANHRPASRGRAPAHNSGHKH